MSNSMMTIQVPGKLMIAGEFAVLEPHQQLAVMAVDRFVEIKIWQSEEKLLSLEKFHLHDIKWDFTKGEVTIHSVDNHVNFVQESLSVACRYLMEHNIPVQNVGIRVKSDLDDKNTGKKFGLGSSAAVSVGVITAILAFHLQEKPDPNIVFRLAAISHVKAQGNGSGADVAASAFGGILQYSSFQAEWLREKYREANSITKLVNTDWEYCSIKPIQLPKSIYLCIGWTGSPASTGNLVKKILQLKTSKMEKFQAFLQESGEAVHHFLEGIEDENIPLLLQGIKQNRNALITVGNEAHTELETPMIKKLCDLAEGFGGAAKQSGAGGGDCGIAFMPTKESADRLKKSWKEAGIIPLDINPCPNGAMIL